MDSEEMWALCRNLHTKKMRSLKTSDLLEITGHNMYRRFSPSNEQDFKPKTDYGYIEGEKLFIHTIFKLSFIEDEIVCMARDPRKYGVTASKRKSITPVVYPAKKFQLQEEKRSSNDDRAKVKTASNQQKNETDRKLLKIFNNKQKLKKEIVNHEAPKDGIVGGNVSVEFEEIKPKENNKGKAHVEVSHKEKSVSNKCHVDVLKTTKERKKNDTETVKENPQAKDVTASCDLKSRKRTAVDNQDYLPQKVTKIDAGQPLKITCKGDCAEAVYFKKKLKDIEVRNKILSTEISDLKEKLKELESLVGDLTEENTTLKENLNNAMIQVDALKLAKLAVEESVKNDIQELKATVGQLPGLMGASSRNGRTCWASKVESNLCPEEGTISVPDGMVHIGSNLFVSKTDISEVEDNYGKFTARLKALCSKIWKDDIRNWSLSGSDDGNMKKINVSITKAIAALLRGMEWEKEDLPCPPKQKNDKTSCKDVVQNKPRDASCITEKVVRLAMRHCLFDIRCKLLSKEEKEALKEKKKREKKVTKKLRGSPKSKGDKKYSGDGNHRSSSESEPSPIKKATDNEDNSIAKLKGEPLKSRASSTPLKGEGHNNTIHFDIVYDESNTEQQAGAENATLNSVEDD